ncbi:MAG: alpha-D-ribose 1-methylphosphonate 5-triphosphate diphosphatase [Granulosicoccus sp.]
MTSCKDFQLCNAQLVLSDRVTVGSVRVTDGLIVEVEPGDNGSGENLQGDYLIPGLVELHTDHLESHYCPRPGVRWNPLAAIQSHDAQVAAAGITTVLDCLRMGADDADFEPGEMLTLAGVLQQAGDQNRLRAEHLLHLRCEVSSPNVLDDYAQFENHEKVMLMSLMDHAPGQRQFADMAVFEYYHRSKDGLDEKAFEAFASRRLENSQRYSESHRATISAMCKARNITLASHDDATLAHVEDAVQSGIQISEFPTTVEAASAGHERGMSILMGAPNVVRGRSHSGNVGARQLAHLGTLDMLSSDYVPSSLLHAPFVLSLQEQLMSLPDAIALVTSNPARSIGFDDRGVIAEGYRADLVQVRYQDNVPTVKCVWREGVRVA